MTPRHVTDVRICAAAWRTRCVATCACGWRGLPRPTDTPGQEAARREAADHQGAVIELQEITT